MYQLNDHLPDDLSDFLLAAELRFADLPVMRALGKNMMFSLLVFDGGTVARFERAGVYWVVTLSNPLPLSFALSLSQQFRKTVRAEGMSGGIEPTRPVNHYHVDSREGLRALAAVLRAAFGAEDQIADGFEQQNIHGFSVWRPPYYASMPWETLWIKTLMGIAQFGELFRGTYDSTAALERAYDDAVQFYGADDARAKAIYSELSAYYERTAIKLTENVAIYQTVEPGVVVELERVLSKFLALLIGEKSQNVEQLESLRAQLQQVRRQVEEYWQQRFNETLDAACDRVNADTDLYHGDLYFVTLRLLLLKKRMQVNVAAEETTLAQYRSQLPPEIQAYYDDLVRNMWC